MSGPIVETTCGRLRGQNPGGVSVFKGITYGISARFQLPAPAAPQPGIRDATSFGPTAPQILSPALTDRYLNWYAPTGDGGEVCQTLNLFTPSCDAGRRPVMVWLHGGGWMNLSANTPGTDATALAATEDVVVVTVNHRLGALGFLGLGLRDPAYADAGNAGLLDIVLALQWVRDNISQFGGDPGNVTIFGQSGGAAKVASMVAMPAAEGLFHKAIIQSLSGGLQVATQDEADGIVGRMMAAAGLPDDATDALAALPLADLLAAQGRMAREFRPVMDGRTFSRHPFLPDAPPRNRSVPIMVGCTDTESSYYLRDNIENFHIGEDALLFRLQHFLSVPPEEARDIRQIYGDAMPGATPSEVLIAVTTDQIFKRNTYHAAHLHAVRGGTAYAYLFTRRSPVLGGLLAAPHCADVPFIFGTAEVARAFVGAGPEIEVMTRMMMRTWAAFARTGTPENPTLPEWKPYRDTDHKVMALEPRPELRHAPGEDVRAALEHLPRLDYATDRTKLIRG